MTDIKKYHREAMEMATAAHDSQKAGDYKTYLQLTKEAFEKEKAAAWQLFDKFDKEPTRSVLFRSAAQLAFNCGKMRESEKLIAAALAGNPPTEILVELRELNKEVQDAMGAVI